ncbi:hypothetical protein LPJ55_001700 [Coemansia sp. RSA 990]|nr:hypothetical protein LPJ55_001700 [Coemansia sp. RSA 990]
MNSKKTAVLDETDMLIECTGQQDGKYIVFFGLSMYVYFVLGDELLDQIATTSACSLQEVQKMADIEPCLKIKDMSPHGPQMWMGKNGKEVVEEAEVMEEAEVADLEAVQVASLEAVAASLEPISGKGSGSYGDRPPSYASLFPNRNGFNAGGKPSGSGDSSHSYTPPPAYSAGASYASANRGQTVPPYSFKSNSPAIYYASTSRSVYPGAWGYGYYPIYPYPWWAYGAGYWVGSTYHTNSTNKGVKKYSSEYRNITVVDATSTPLIGDYDLFNTTNNITFTDFNNGSIRIAPCGNKSSSQLNVPASDCDFIVLDIRKGLVQSGHAKSNVKNDITFFQLTLGSRTSTLRTLTISSTKKKDRGGVIAGIVLGVVGFVVLVGLGTWLLKRWRRKH